MGLYRVIFILTYANYSFFPLGNFMKEKLKLDIDKRGMPEED
jgi:hypothetical protein